MDVDKIVNSPLINLAALAKLMYPGNKSPRQYLYKKIHNKERQSITYTDREKIKEIINKLFADKK